MSEAIEIVNSEPEVIELAVDFDSEVSARDAEAWAVGKRGGVDVSEDDPTYHNNSKYYSEFAESEAQEAIDTIRTAAEEIKDDSIVAINQAAEEARESIPSDYTQLSDDVTGLKSAFEQLDANVITDSAGPAPIVSIADGADGMPMRKVDVAIEPVQDLHGYDNPWPAGGGKNLLPLSVFNTDIFTINDDGSVTQTGNDVRSESSMLTFPLKAGTYTLSMSATTGVHNLYYSDNGSWVQLVPPTVEKTKTFTLESDQNIYIKASVGGTYPITMKIQIESGSTATAWTPYSNICPISGFDSVKVTRTGKNLLVRSSATTEKYLNSSGEAVNSPASAGGDYWSISDYIPVDGNITISGILTAGNAPYSAWYNDSFTYISSFKQANNTFTPPAGAKYMRISFYSTDEAIQIEYGSSVSAHESYQGQTYEVTFPSEAGTVYGGTLDTVTGKLVVDRAIVTMNGTENVYRVEDNLAQVGGYSQFKNRRRAVSSHYKSVAKSWTQLIPGEWQLVDYTIGFKETRFTDIATVKAYITEQYQNGTPLQFIGELKEPIVVRLDPTEIKTLLGVNNIWSDAGNTAITYPADTKLYIDAKIAEIQALILENNG